MDDNLRKQIFNTLILRETDDLVEIWVTNDRVEWSDTAFEVIEDILKQRLGELPPQHEPVLEHFDPNTMEGYDERIFVNKFKSPKRKPVFYNPKWVMEMIVGMNRMSLLAIVVIFFSNLPEVIKLQEMIRPIFPNGITWDGLAFQISMMVGFALIVLECILVFFGLRGLAAVLRILMEMEHNSRTTITIRNDDGAAS